MNWIKTCRDSFEIAYSDLIASVDSPSAILLVFPRLSPLKIQPGARRMTTVYRQLIRRQTLNARRSQECDDGIGMKAWRVRLDVRHSMRCRLHSEQGRREEMRVVEPKGVAF